MFAGEQRFNFQGCIERNIADRKIVNKQAARGWLLLCLGNCVCTRKQFTASQLKLPKRALPISALNERALFGVQSALTHIFTRIHPQALYFARRMETNSSFTFSPISELTFAYFLQIVAFRFHLHRFSLPFLSFAFLSPLAAPALLPLARHFSNSAALSARTPSFTALRERSVYKHARAQLQLRALQSYFNKIFGFFLVLMNSFANAFIKQQPVVWRWRS